MKKSEVLSLRTGSIIQARFNIHKKFDISDFERNVGPVTDCYENDLVTIISIDTAKDYDGKDVAHVKILNITQGKVIEDEMKLARLEHCFSLMKL